MPGCGAQHPHRRNRRQRSAAAPGAGGVPRVSVPRGRGAVTRQRRACGLVDAPASAVSTSRGILRRAPPLSRPCCRACIAPPEAVAREEHQGTTLEVNARARRKPTQLGNRGGGQDLMRACVPASGRWESTHSGRAIRRRSRRKFQATGRKRGNPTGYPTQRSAVRRIFYKVPISFTGRAPSSHAVGSTGLVQSPEPCVTSTTRNINVRSSIREEARNVLPAEPKSAKCSVAS